MRGADEGSGCAQARNEADQLIYQGEKNLVDFKDKITPEIVEGIQTATSDLRAAKEGDNVEDIKAKVEALSKAMQKIGEHMSTQGAASSDTSSESGDSASGDKKP
jgi:molecular chaperone DnaK